MYSVYNLIDGNPVIAWAEGKKDSSINEYIESKEPFFISEMKLTILDVYKGTGYDDTCLSEVKIFTSD